MLQEKGFRREPAKKTSISEIFGALTEGNAARVNILATIVDKNEHNTFKSMIADDGTGQIQLRLFGDEGRLYEKQEIGSFSVIIGKLRTYGEEKYVAPEIIKKLGDARWAEVRQLELRAGQPDAGQRQPEGGAENADIRADAISKDKIGIYELIKQLDTGKGAEATEVIIKGGANAEGMINEMLKSGDIFELTPGKLKVLE